MIKQKRVAIVYDWIDKWGGVERVLLTLHEMFPKAVFYTSYFDKEKATWAKSLKIKTSFLQSFPSFIKNSRILSFIFYPFAFESFDFSEYDLVISVTSSFAKSIITKPSTKHICYLLTPTRYLWSHEKEYIKKCYWLFVNCYLKFLKKWDFVTAQRPDKIISISEAVRERCKKYYHRKSEVIYPGFDINYWKNIKDQISKIKVTDQISKILRNKKYFLVISRLEPYKKIDLAIKVFNKLEIPLIIIGEGSQADRLKQIAGENIIFKTKLSDPELGKLYLKAEALIMPQEEDFGYVSLESQFFDCPVIAYKKGGALETVIDQKTGLFFEDQTEQSLSKTVERFNKIKYNLKVGLKEFGTKNVEKFSKKIFIKKIQENL